MKPEIIIIAMVILVPFLLILVYQMGKYKGRVKYIVSNPNSTSDKISEDTKINMLCEPIKNVEINNILSPIVIDVYETFLKLPHTFKEDNCVINNEIFGICIWSANDWNNRHFRDISHGNLKKYNKTLKEINSELSKADKTILDVICKRVEVNNSEFISKLFLNPKYDV